MPFLPVIKESIAAAKCDKSIVVSTMSSNTKTQSNVDEEFQDELKPGTTLLHGQYVIEQFLNNGGFGITYLAKDSLHRTVVIKECFPEAICRRANSTVRVRSRNQADAFRAIVELFIDEARNLAQLSHPNIVGVHQVFEENDTAYMAMDFVEGRDLLEILEGPDQLEPAVIEKVVLRLLDAVEFIHKEGVLHRDIAPDNVLLSTNNEPVLIDFGAARATVLDETSYLGTMRTVKDGYSPQEFYVQNSDQHPSSDLYSLAASIYHVMSGDLPANAQKRMVAIASGEPDPYVSIKEKVEGYSETFLDVIDLALAVAPKDRIQSAAQWRSLIADVADVHIARGTVSRPMLAVDNGTVLDQFNDEDDVVSTASKTVSRVKTVIGDAVVATRDAVSSAELLSSMPLPAKTKGGNGLYIGVASVALLALVGVGALLMGGDEETAAVEQQVPANEIALPAPVETTPVVAAPVPSPVAEETETASRKPEQVPFFLAGESAGDVQVSSAAGASAPRISSAPSTVPAAQEAAPEATQSPSFVEILDTQATAQVAESNDPVVSRAVVDFAVVADPNDASLVASVDGAAAEFFEPGQRIISVNGFPISSLEEVGSVVEATADFSAGSAVTISFGIEDDGGTRVLQATLPSKIETTLLNGAEFATTSDGTAWKTVVVSGTGAEESDLQPGDEIVALMPNNEMVDTEGSFVSLLNRELDAGTTQFNFAIRRNGDMWLASMSYNGG